MNAPVPELPQRQRFRVLEPRAALDPTARVIAAYDVVAQAEGPLQLAGDFGSGYRLLAYVALVSLSHIEGSDSVREWMGEIMALLPERT